MHGPIAIALPLAFAAGVVSFLSPCTLPLLPGYLSYISGLSSEEVRDRANANTVLSAAALFVLGFSLVFVAFGATASYIGQAFLSHRTTLERAAGIFIIFMALIMLGAFRLPIFAREKRFHPGRQFGMWSAFPLGMAFGFGWTPCIGPVLTAILGFAAAETTVQKGALLLFVYAMGLGLPFLGVALFAERVLGSLRGFRRYSFAINGAGGAVLLVMGVFLLLNRWTEVLAPFLNWYSQLNLPT